MNKELYIDLDGKYVLIDYDKNHSQLLFRRHKGKDNSYNHDIVFKGVYSLNIQIVYDGLKVEAVKRNNLQTVSNLANRDFIFKLSTKSGIESFVDATALGMFMNKLDYSVSSLGEFTWSLENELKLWVTEEDLK